MLDQKLATILADQVFLYAIEVANDLSEKRHVVKEKARILADLRNCFTYECIHAEKQEAKEKPS